MFIEPVSGSMFFGREEVLGTLQKRVTALKGGYRQNLALTGPMLCGKSSILRHFIKNTSDLEVIPIYIEMDGDDFNVFSLRFMASLLHGYLISAGQASPMEGNGSLAPYFHGGWSRTSDDFDRLCGIAGEFIPDTVQCVMTILKYMEKRKIDLAYEGLLALTSVFKSETGKNCVVILDEFHNLSNFGLKKPFQVFGKFIMVQKNTMYVVSSSQETLLRDILSSKLSLLFGNFEVLEINGFDNHSARAFMSGKIEALDDDGGMTDYLIQLSQGNPFYLAVIAGRISGIYASCGERLNKKEILLDAMAELLYGSDGVLNQYFTNTMNFFLEKKNRKKYIPVLMSMSMGNSTLKAIQKGMGKKDKDLGLKLNKLREMDIIWNSGVFYKITDKLFEYWIAYVHAVKTRSMIDDMGMKYLEFKNALEKDYECYRMFRNIKATDVIAGIFEKFNNEKIELGLSQRKLSSFDEVKKMPCDGNITPIIGQTASGRWIFHIKQGDIAVEQDIADMKKMPAGSGKNKVLKKILIPLGSIDENAFLLAKEHGIWVWDAATLNRIFRVYGRFELVL
jgi:hypothetical protein